MSLPNAEQAQKPRQTRNFFLKVFIGVGLILWLVSLVFFLVLGNIAVTWLHANGVLVGIFDFLVGLFLLFVSGFISAIFAFFVSLFFGGSSSSSDASARDESNS